MGDKTKIQAGDDRLETTDEPRDSGGKSGGRKGVLLILAGLVVTGIAAGYSWIRGLPKDRP